MLFFIFMVMMAYFPFSIFTHVLGGVEKFLIKKLFQKDSDICSNMEKCVRLKKNSLFSHIFPFRSNISLTEGRIALHWKEK